MKSSQLLYLERTKNHSPVFASGVTWLFETPSGSGAASVLQLTPFGSAVLYFVHHVTPCNCAEKRPTQCDKTALREQVGKRHRRFVCFVYLAVFNRISEESDDHCHCHCDHNDELSVVGVVDLCHHVRPRVFLSAMRSRVHEVQDHSDHSTGVTSQQAEKGTLKKTMNNGLTQPAETLQERAKSAWTRHKDKPENLE